MLFPSRCAFCGAVISHKESICAECLTSLPLIPSEVCRICGIEKGLCDCRKRSFACTRRTAPFYYEGAAKRGILRFKKRAKFGGYRALAALLAKRVKEEYTDISFDAVVSVPPSKRSKRERGFDPAALLAEEAARLLSLPYEKNLLIKIYENKPQKGMGQVARIGNVVGVYDLKNPDAVKKNYLLVDDVITTGATVNECAKILRIFGAERVYAAAVCLDKPLKKNSK